MKFSRFAFSLMIAGMILSSTPSTTKAAERFELVLDAPIYLDYFFDNGSFSNSVQNRSNSRLTLVEMRSQQGGPATEAPTGKFYLELYVNGTTYYVGKVAQIPSKLLMKLVKLNELELHINPKYFKLYESSFPYAIYRNGYYGSAGDLWLRQVNPETKTAYGPTMSFKDWIKNDSEFSTQ